MGLFNIKHVKHAMAFIALTSMVGCASSQTILPVVESPLVEVASQRVLVATTRAPEADELVRFARERSPELSYVDVDISIPLDRRPGEIVEPSTNSIPASAFTARSVQNLDNRNGFLAAINQDMATRPPGERVAFVFVHGYNVDFAAGLYMHAQLTHDFGFEALPIHYSWPSAGVLPGYIYDRDSVQFARDGLVELLDILVESNAEKIHFVGHSMGTLLTMEALRQASLSGRADILRALEAVVLASPDIDVDVFRQQASLITPLPEPFVIFVSSRDQALRLSQDIRGGAPRVGSGADADELRQLGFVVIDLSDVEDGSDSVNHSTFAQSPSLIKMVQSGEVTREALLRANDDPFAVQGPISGLRSVANSVVDLVQ